MTCERATDLGTALPGSASSFPITVLVDKAVRDQFRQALLELAATPAGKALLDEG